MLCIAYSYQSFYSTPIEPFAFLLEVVEMNEGSVNISWSPDPSLEYTVIEQQTFVLTNSHGSSKNTISLNDTFFYFTAPPSASPCEVFNFSVTATPVGATYTGDGCSVPSPVLSIVLPVPLPSIGELESSIQYSLSKQGNGKGTLNVTIQVSHASLEQVY